MPHHDFTSLLAHRPVQVHDVRSCCTISGAQVVPLQCRQRRRRPDAVCRRGPQQIEALCTLRFTEEELAYLRGCASSRATSSTPRPVPAHTTYIHVEPAQRSGRDQHRHKGPWLHTILFEIPVLAIVNECTSAARSARPTRRRPPPSDRQDRAGARRPALANLHIATTARGGASPGTGRTRCC